MTDLQRSPTGPVWPRRAADDEPTILGFPAEGATADEDDGDGLRLVVRRRADRVAAYALVLAGVAAAASLGLPWVRGESTPGITLLRQGLADVGSGPAELLRSGLWQPVAVVLGGGVLLLLGLLLLVPARTHRFLGVVALLGALGTTAAVTTLLAGAEWRADRFGAGLWCAAVVATAGLLGALKGMLTLPRVTLPHVDPAERIPPPD